ncbi:MAG: 2OG-Fe(II) oxygenase [Pseudomonadota bacterium]|nr:2OG-Fe(II) oxygenase [Pseudomonadota bacterium]
MSIEQRIAAIDWQRLAEEIDRQGWATTGPLLTAAERAQLIASYDDEDLFRSHVVMARHGFGQGEYRYFAYPLPPLVQQLREGLYERLAALANHWRQALGVTEPFPPKFEDYILRCHEAGQTRPTPLILRYGPGDYNCLHQDLYGELNFPLQAAFLLSEPGADFTGGELVLTEQRPRMQSRVQVVRLHAGEAVIFAVNHRPVQGTRGTYRVTMRHGVSPLREGQRHTLGIILHDAA